MKHLLFAIVTLLFASPAIAQSTSELLSLGLAERIFPPQVVTTTKVGFAYRNLGERVMTDGNPNFAVVDKGMDDGSIIVFNRGVEGFIEAKDATDRYRCFRQVGQSTCFWLWKSDLEN